MKTKSCLCGNLTDRTKNIYICGLWSQCWPLTSSQGTVSSSKVKSVLGDTDYASLLLLFFQLYLKMMQKGAKNGLSLVPADFI